MRGEEREERGGGLLGPDGERDTFGSCSWLKIHVLYPGLFFYMDLYMEEEELRSGLFYIESGKATRPCCTCQRGG